MQAGEAGSDRRNIDDRPLDGRVGTQFEQLYAGLDEIVTDLTFGEFIDALSDGGILGDDVLKQLEAQHETASEQPVQQFAQQLIDDGLITSYQARVLK